MFILEAVIFRVPIPDSADAILIMPNQNFFWSTFNFVNLYRHAKWSCFIHLFPRNSWFGNPAIWLEESILAYNPGQKVVNKFTKLRKIGFCVEFFTADFLQVFNENLKIWLLDVWLSTHYQTQAFQGFS